MIFQASIFGHRFRVGLQQKNGVHFRMKAIYEDVLILKTENGSFSTFADVLDPGNGRAGSALFKFGLAFFRDTSNDVCRLFRISD